MRWLWFMLMVACFAVAFRTHSMGLAALALLGALGFLLMGTLAMAASRLESRGRNAVAMLGTQEARHLREQIEQRKRESAAAAGTVAVAGGAVATTVVAGTARADGDVDDSVSGDDSSDGDGGD